MTKYILIDKETGKCLYDLLSTTRRQAVNEVFDVLGVVLQEEIKPKYKRTCIVCGTEFITIDGRFFKCQEHRNTSNEERELVCVTCTREFKTYDKRIKRCEYCITRDYHMNILGIEQYCRVCERLKCLEQNCEYYKKVIK